MRINGWHLNQTAREAKPKSRERVRDKDEGAGGGQGFDPRLQKELEQLSCYLWRGTPQSELSNHGIKVPRLLPIQMFPRVRQGVLGNVGLHEKLMEREGSKEVGRVDSSVEIAVKWGHPNTLTEGVRTLLDHHKPQHVHHAQTEPTFQFQQLDLFDELVNGWAVGGAQLHDPRCGAVVGEVEKENPCT